MRLFLVDAFTARPFAGNPAAVCLLETRRDDDWMQAVAAEMNLSETAFVRSLDDGFELRWFTPAIEVELCGHATLVSAHALCRDATDSYRLIVPEGAVGERCEIMHLVNLLDIDIDLGDVVPENEVIAYLNDRSQPSASR